MPVSLESANMFASFLYTGKLDLYAPIFLQIRGMGIDFISMWKICSKKRGFNRCLGAWGDDFFVYAPGTFCVEL